MARPTLIKYLRIVNFAVLNTNNPMPASFLIDVHGDIVEISHGARCG
ncbi:MAG: hypothetical protein ACRETO_11475 [Gammaproteobacteria bacterium]